MKGSALATFALGALLGAAGVGAYAYWSQLQAAYRNRDKIATGANLVNDALALKRQLGI